MFNISFPAYLNSPHDFLHVFEFIEKFIGFCVFTAFYLESVVTDFSKVPKLLQSYILFHL